MTRPYNYAECNGLLVMMLLLIVGLATCKLPDLSKIRLGACIDGCNTAADPCLSPGGKLTCPKGAACFDLVEKCFDESTACSDKCWDDDACNHYCAKMANTCSDNIQDCVDMEMACAEERIDSGKECLQNLVTCVATCAKDAETVLRK